MRIGCRFRFFHVLAVAVLLAAAGCSSGQPTVAGTPAPQSSAPSPASPTGSKLLDMRTIKLYDGAPFDVPARAGGCPAATVRFTDRTPRTRVGGAEYYLSGEGEVTSGDVNLDGRVEQLALVSCVVGGRGHNTLVVVGATAPTSYATIAAGPLSTGVAGLLVQGRTIITYSSGYQFIPANELGRYRITNGNQITRVS